MRQLSIDLGNTPATSNPAPILPATVERTPVQATLPRLPPATEAALGQAADAFKVVIPRTYVSPELRHMGGREGVFLNIRDGASASTRFQMGLDENQGNQFKYLIRKYGEGNVDMTGDGRFVLRNQPVEGSPTGFEDILVDPHGLDSAEFAEMGAQAVPMIAGAAGALRGGRRGPSGVGRVLRAVTGEVLGENLTGLGQDALVRYIRDDEVNVPELTKKRAKQALIDAALGIAMAGVGKIGTKIHEGLYGLEDRVVGETAAEVAQRNLRERTGIERPMTPGETAQSPVAMRLESMMAARPGTSGVIDEMTQAKRASEARLRRALHGLPLDSTDAELEAALPRRDFTGQAALDRLRQETTLIENAETAARQNILTEGSTEAQRVARIDLVNPIDIPNLGGTLRRSVAGGFRTERDALSTRYDNFVSRPEIQARTVEAGDLAQAVRGVERRFVPTAERDVIDPATGAVTGIRVESLNDFVPSKFVGFVERLRGLQGARISVNSLKQIRTSIDNSIAEGVAIPGVDVAQLEALRDAVDNSITTSLRDMDPNLLAEWDALRGDYAAHSTRYNRKGIREMLVPEAERGSIGNTELVERIQGNSPGALDRYNEYRDFFGATSNEFRSLQAAARQDILGGNTIDRMTGYIRGDRLRARLANTRPEIVDDLFGVDQRELERIGALLERARGTTLDIAELNSLATSSTFTAPRLQALVDAEQQATEAYANDLMNAAARGTLRAEQINPSTFVRRAMSMDPQDVERVMGILGTDPDLVRDIQRLGVEELWDTIQMGTGSGKMVAADQLERALGDSTRKASLRALIGTDALEGLQALLEHARFDSSLAKGWGGSSIGGQAEMTALFLQGEMNGLLKIGTRMLMGMAYTGPLRRSVTNMLKSQDRGRFLNAMVASEPFVSEVLEQYGEEVGTGIMYALGQWIEPMQRKELAIKGELKGVDPTTLNMTEAEYKQYLRNQLSQ